ncbi:hypothetical protein IAD21_00299 [Abditibacteriota bacterium]|nr:hypothetical protein IAD21_00299 [Abditibacteriota bacterium]
MISLTKTVLCLAPFCALIGGCHSNASSPDQIRTQFIQAVAADDFTQMSALLDKTGGYQAIRLGDRYDTPESQKDPMLRGEAIIMWAIRTGHFKPVLALVGRTPAVKNDFGRTPLMYAALYGPEVGPDQSLMSVVLQSPDKQLSAVDNNGDSALLMALRRGAPNAAGWLLRAGAPIAIGRNWIRNKRGQSALDLAVASKNSWCITLVTERAKLAGLPLQTR